MFVQDLNHACESLFLVRPVSVPEFSPVGYSHAVVVNAFFSAAFIVRMGKIGSVKQKEGAIAVFSDKFQGFFEDELRSIIDRDFGNSAAFPTEGLPSFPFRVESIAQLDLLTVANQEFRIEIMGVKHVHISIELMESVPSGIVVRDGISDSPFTEAAGAIAGRL